MRGWAEPLHHNVPTGELDLKRHLDMPPISGTTTIWRLTDSGWGVLHRRQASVPASPLKLIAKPPPPAVFRSFGRSRSSKG